MGARSLIALGVLATLGAPAIAPSHAQAPPASSSARVAPDIVRPGATGDEADMARRPTGVDAEFVDKAAMAGETELLASRLALDRSSNPDVKAFARRMIDDHEPIAAELRELGVRKGVPVQARMFVDPGLAALRIKNGHAFDAGYVSLAGPAVHEAAIRAYETEARDGRDSQLRAFATRVLPMLRDHLAAARRLAGTVAAAR
ncbi:DUF4142 domain-containing protein [Burkholderia stagnalis]